METATPVSIAVLGEAERIRKMIITEIRQAGVARTSTWTRHSTRCFEAVFMLDYDLNLGGDEDVIIINELRLEGYITSMGGDIKPTLTMQTLHPTYQPLLRQRLDLFCELLIRWQHMAKFGKSPGAIKPDLAKAMDMTFKAMEVTQKVTH